MKVIEAMKQIKELQRKFDDLKVKVGQYCADLEHETPLYGTVQEQTATVRGWIQSGSDILKEILRLRVAIQRTNLETKVSINLGEKVVEKTIAEWIHRRRDLSVADLSLWKAVGDRGLREVVIPSTQQGVAPTTAKIRRYYDPREKDAMVNLYAAEATVIDSSLEVVNATTDLIE